jgi:hypothetical protein
MILYWSLSRFSRFFTSFLDLWLLQVASKIRLIPDYEGI